MEYSTMEKLGVRASRLGFGCMRLPVTPEGKIDELRAMAMLDTAYRAGVNYFDTAFFYHQRTSEEFVGRALARYPRDSFYLATKLPLSLIDTLDKAKEIYEGQFQKLRTTYFDFYLLHAVNANHWKKVKELGILDWLLAEQQAGRIRHLGFSFHDRYEVFEEIASYRQWDFCQIQFNYMDIDVQAGMKGYALAEKLGIPLVIMEPVKGGSLAKLPEDIAGRFRAARPEKSVASWAMRWVASLPNCKVILSGMTDEAQVADNLDTFTHFEPLSEREQAVVSEVREELRARVFVGCTACRYCMPCPFGVDIPRNFSMMNEYARYGNERELAFHWKNMTDEAKATACQKCGKCEKVCPQAIAIREKLAEIAQRMA